MAPFSRLQRSAKSRQDLKPPPEPAPQQQQQQQQRIPSPDPPPPTRAPQLRRAITDAEQFKPGYCNHSPDISSAPMLSLSSQLPDQGDECTRLPPSRFTVLPREEEGKEELPSYSCAIFKSGIMMQKMELDSPFDRARKRGWKNVYLVLNGTKLDVHEPAANALARSQKFLFDKPIEWHAGKLLESYTLQLAEVGTAADYRKRSFVIRLRAQTKQFLLASCIFDTFLEWLEALSAAIDLAPALDERCLPKYRTIPRGRRRRPPPARPQPNATSPTSDSAEGTTDHPSDRSTDELLGFFAHDDGTIIPSLAPPTACQIALAAERRARRRADENAPELSFDERGKWAPRPRITREDNVRYAKRCMTVLYSDAPRQSDYVIFKEKRYVLVWERKEMVPDDGRPRSTSAISDPELPKYDEIMRTEMPRTMSIVL